MIKSADRETGPRRITMKLRDGIEQVLIRCYHADHTKPYLDFLKSLIRQMILFPGAQQYFKYF